MCWVMPPASPAATRALRIASSKLVLPWSTWPITVTTGGRRIKCSRSFSSIISTVFIILENRNTEFVGHCLDGGHVEGLGDRGDDALEEQGFDDLGALHAEHVGELLHREVVLRHHDHFGPYLLGLPRCTQLHGAATLALTCRFFAAFAHCSDGFRCGALLRFRLGWTGQAGRQHHGLLFTGVAAGLCSKGVVVLANDVNLLALLLRRAAAQGFQLGAVIPVGTSRTPLSAGTWSGSVARTTGCRGRGWRRRPRHWRRGLAFRTIRRARTDSAAIGTAWRRSTRAATGFLQLHELARCDGFAHATGHSRAGGCSRPTVAVATTSSLAISADGLAHQLNRISRWARTARSIHACAACSRA